MSTWALFGREIDRYVTKEQELTDGQPGDPCCSNFEYYACDMDLLSNKQHYCRLDEMWKQGFI